MHMHDYDIVKKIDYEWLCQLCDYDSNVGSQKDIILCRVCMYIYI